MSTVTRRETNPTVVMEPLLSGEYVDHVVYEAHAWRCDGCGLVWEKRWHAETCESRDHRSSFEQGPYGIRGTENGRPIGTPRYYTRRAFRREKVVTVAPAVPAATRTVTVLERPVRATSFQPDPNCTRDQCGGKPGPSHTGSYYCRSGSLASGGTRPHCSCSSCY